MADVGKITFCCSNDYVGAVKYRCDESRKTRSSFKAYLFYILVKWVYIVLERRMDKSVAGFRMENVGKNAISRFFSTFLKYHGRQILLPIFLKIN